MVLTVMRSSLALLRRGAPLAQKSALAPAAAMGARAFSGNVEYPKIEGTVAELTKNLSNIGARLSIPTAALYLTTPKINHIVREMKGKDELKEVQKVLLLCDAKLVYPSTFASGTFFNACLKLDAADLALDFVRKAENMRHYVNNQSFVRLAKHYADQEDQDIVDEIVQLMKKNNIALTTKTYHFRVMNAKNLNKFDDAVAIAKEAAEARQINSNLIIMLLNGLEGDALKEQIPLAKYLAAKGDVIPNARLTELLADN
uniref:Pentacotripeptide-repeat region of PRORP domain-containing protein n=1 Tax=Globisporangium ultimum (strain ATCC 200006 / CBS 805.95 / DAOM BR144) TaxID=431595 RepID=K3WLZ1_GLOUD